MRCDDLGASDAHRIGRVRRGAVALAGALVCAALAAGCGIRTTSVPVDAGAAPSRVPCSLPADDVPALGRHGLPVEIQLVCASRLVGVDRTVQIDESRSGRLRIARALLDQLRAAPSSEERRAGFSTDVPATLRIGEGHEGDPAGTLRLSVQPEDLPAEALAQIVCTYADNQALVSKETVVLGGPGDYPARGYLCTSETKTRPEAAPTPSTLGLP
ncbi:hypothetical protein ACPXCE_06260 [Streptomyces sp. DT24]|uniref:hypothetical protein n=1 Tax=unclassified Streptomyces TaxID=2593676 RepID=UPI0023B98AC7|nr:hypothetical protein [Streptomyces sp. AM 4-1-1]WEH35531.1 hypothetical protein PZB75_20550 [Streptomyces sp. AM 4-1-1]